MHPSPRPALRALALTAALLAGLAAAPAASAGAGDVCKPDPDCRPLCRAKARALLARCAEEGSARDECRARARELRSACALRECGGCEQRCELLGQELLGGCLEDGGELAACRAEAELASAACIERRCGPCACPQVYDPVCGKDGMTYGNACEAACARVEVAHEGPCEPVCPPLPCDVACEHGQRLGPDGCPTCGCNPPPGCERDEDCGEGQLCRELCSLRPCPAEAPDCAPCVGVCLPRPPEPCVCPELYQPVCGVDGKTYSSACHAGCAGVEVAHEGPCEPACRRNDDCGPGEVCHPPTASCRPQCAIECLRYDPVCGEDGVTYGCGEVEAHCQGVAVAHPGQCRPECGPNEVCPAR